MYYKVLNGLKSCHGGNYTWTQGRKTPYAAPIMCESGYHFTDEKNIVHWMGRDFTVYELRVAKSAEVKTSYWEQDKYVASQVILGKKIGKFTEEMSDTLNLHLINCYYNSLRRVAKTKKEKSLVLSVKKFLSKLKKSPYSIIEYNQIKERARSVSNNKFWEKIAFLGFVVYNYSYNLFSLGNQDYIYDRSTTQLFWKLITKKGK